MNNDKLAVYEIITQIRADLKPLMNCLDYNLHGAATDWTEIHHALDEMVCSMSSLTQDTNNFMEIENEKEDD